MPVDSGGNVSRPSNPIPVTGQDADAPQVNVPVDDIYSILNLMPFLDGRKSWLGNQNLNGRRITDAADAVGAQDYVTLSQLQALLAQFSPVQTGTLHVYTLSSSAAPAGYVFANGAAVSRTTYAALWAAVQAGNNLAASQGAKTAGQYGPGNGSTTFTLPNLYADGGYFIRPITSGRGIGTVQADAYASHTHAGTTNSGGAHVHPISIRSDIASGGQAQVAAVIETGTMNTKSGGAHTHPFTTNASGGTETRPKNIAYPVLIKV